ncbi:MAG: hypothetical protein AB1714_18645 [Acidobacteriota bacterium]
MALLLVAPPFGLRAESGGTAHGEHAKSNWVKQVTAENVGVGKLVPLPTGGWLGVGSAPSGRSSGDVDGWIMCLDESGDITWQRGIGGPFDDMFVDVAPTVDSGWLLAGLTWSFGVHGTVCYGWLCKLDSQLGVSWQRRFRDTSIQGLQFVTSILAAEDGTSIALITSGSCRSNAFTLASLGPAGAVRWSKSYAFSKSIANLAYDSIRLGDGTIVIGGTTQELTSSQTSLRRWVATPENGGAMRIDDPSASRTINL